MSDEWGLAKDFVLCDEHRGQKVYEIEREVTYIVKTLVIAKDDDDAFKKYLDCSETINCEGYDAPNNSFDIVSGAKEYSNHKGTRLVGVVQREDEQDENSLLEVA